VCLRRRPTVFYTLLNSFYASVAEALSVSLQLLHAQSLITSIDHGLQSRLQRIGIGRATRRGESAPTYHLQSIQSSRSSREPPKSKHHGNNRRRRRSSTRAHWVYSCKRFKSSTRPSSNRQQVLQRHFSRWSTVSYAISILGVLGSVPATFGAPMSSGGPATAVWAWFIGSIMAYCIASSGTFMIHLGEPQLILHQSPNWYPHIRQQEECTMSRNTLCHLNTLQPGRGSSVGATSLVKPPALQVWRIQSPR
jgi:hypothetical protein